MSIRRYFYMFMLPCLLFVSNCLQEPKLKIIDPNNPSLPPSQTFESDQTNLEIISYNALKAKIKRVFNLNDASSTLVLLESLKSEFENTAQFSSGTFRSLLTVFDLACTEADLSAAGLENPTQPNQFWNALTGLDLTQSELDTIFAMISDPGLLNSVQRREITCLTLSLQATVWLKR